MSSVSRSVSIVVLHGSSGGRCGHPRPWDNIVGVKLLFHADAQMYAVPHSPPLGTVGDWRCECGYISESILSARKVELMTADWRRRSLCKNCYPNHPTNQGEPHCFEVAGLTIRHRPGAINITAIPAREVSVLHPTHERLYDAISALFATSTEAGEREWDAPIAPILVSALQAQKGERRSEVYR